MTSKIVALCGGVGGSKLAFGLTKVLAPDELLIAVNTGDDFEHLGLPICPDIDTVTYTLSGLSNREPGWGRAGETWTTMSTLEEMGGQTWFRLGDKDIALHLRRRGLLEEGKPLSEITRVITRALGIKHPVVPMSDDPVRTMVATGEGILAFQDYFVRQQCSPQVTGFTFEGSQTAEPNKDLMAALRAPDLEGIIICPSNPFVSIGPFLALEGVSEAMEVSKAPVIVVSPIVGGAALKGPAAKMMQELGLDVSVTGVANHYGSLIDGMVIDIQDEGLIATLSDDLNTHCCQAVMQSDEDRIDLARECISFVSALKSK